MSRWLKSVNNLLENLDGTAENVAEGVAEGTTVGGVDVGQLIQSSRQALESSRKAVGLGRAGDDEDDDYSDDEDDDDESYEDDYGEEYDEVTADDQDNDDNDEDDDNIVVDVIAADPTITEEEVVVAEEDEEVIVEEFTVEEEIINDSGHVTSMLDDDDESEVAGITSSTTHRLAVLEPANSGGNDKSRVVDPDVDEDAISIEGRRSAGTVSELSFSEADLAGIEDDAKVVAGGASQSRSSRMSGKRSGRRTTQPQRPRSQSTTETENVSVTHQSTSEMMNIPALKSEVDKPATANPKTRHEKVPHGPPHPVLAEVNQVPAPPRSYGRPANASSASTHSTVANASLNKKIQSLQAQLAKSQKELTTALNQNVKLAQQLESSEAEIEAQAKELQRAGEELAQNRAKAQEEQDDLLDEHEEEIDELEKKHQEEVDRLREEYEKTIAEWKNQYEIEQARRQQEGGDWTKELEEAIQREKDAIKRLHDVTIEKSELQSKLDKVTMHDSSLQEQLEAALLASRTASEQERKAQEELDAAADLHARQMAQRQRREAELEQTVLELGSALTLARQQQEAQSAGQASTSFDRSHEKSNVSLTQLKREHATEISKLKEQSDTLSEELETARVSLSMETQLREALQQELADISREREEEASEAQVRQYKYDQKVADLESTITRLQAKIRMTNPSKSQDFPVGSDQSEIHDRNTEDNTSMKQLRLQLDESKREIATMSEQLLRQQDLVESSKTEILALKGRLQSATSRADEAEKALFSSINNSSVLGGSADIESAAGKRPQPFSMRRRVKGGSRGAGMRPGSVRSIRSTLHLGPGRELNHAMDQIAQTIDSIDSWMIDTGYVLRYEPLARLGFFIYLVILHLWSFALVVFHTTEVPHGDFGSMDSNPQHWRTHT